MKKLLCVFVYLIAFTAIMGGILTACTDQPEEGIATPVNELIEYSAINIDSSIKEEIGVEDDEIVICVHNASFIYAFWKYDNIEEVLKSELILDTYYIVVNKGVVVGTYHCDDIGDPNRINLGNLLYDDSETLTVFLNNTIEDQLPQGATVLDVYYLYGRPAHHGSALYYITDMGDFVYYDYYLTYNLLGKQQTFFTASEFFDLMKAAAKDEQEAWDDTEWLPIVIGAGAAVVVAGGAVGIVIYKKKKKAKENVNPEISAPESNP